MSTLFMRALAACAIATSTLAMAGQSGDCGRQDVHACGCQQADPLAGAALYDDVVKYFGIGEHRTATKGDEKTVRWVSKQLSKCPGFEVTTQAWPTRQFFPKQTELRLGKNDSVGAFPVWWPKPTDKNGVSGPLSSDINNVFGRIFYFINVSVPTFSVTSNLANVIHAAAANGAVGVVIVTVANQAGTAASDQFIGLNAPAVAQTEWPVPVVSVGRADQARLDAALSAGEVVNLVSTGDYHDVYGQNVIAVLDRGPAAPVVVVSTPISAWFGAAGERGGGVAMFLGLARWASRETSHTTWIFVATSGHEIRELGVRAFLASDRVPSPTGTAAWVHLGAWQAMYNYLLQGDVLVATTDLDARLMQVVGTPTAAVLANFADPSLNLLLTGSIVYGDLTLIAQAGFGNLFGITYAHEFHHAADDTPVVVGPELLEPTARAYHGALKQFTGE